jgi:hypothetical protein
VILGIEIYGREIMAIPSGLGGLNPDMQLIIKPYLIALMAITCVLFLSNYFKYRLGYMFTGMLLLILMIVQTFMSGAMVRGVTLWTPSNPAMPLANIRDSVIQSWGCGSKYYAGACAIEMLEWESHGATPKCLNTNCVGLGVSYFRGKVYLYSSLLVLTSALSFILAASALHLSNRYAGA